MRQAEAAHICCSARQAAELPHQVFPTQATCILMLPAPISAAPCRTQALLLL